MSFKIIEEFLRVRRDAVDLYKQKVAKACGSSNVKTISGERVWKCARYLMKQLDWVEEYALDKIFDYFTNVLLVEKKAKHCKGIELKT